MHLKKLFDNKLKEKRTTLTEIFKDSSINPGIDRIITKNAINNSRWSINDATIVKHIIELAHALAGDLFVQEVKEVLAISDNTSNWIVTWDIEPNTQHSLTINF